MMLRTVVGTVLGLVSLWLCSLVATPSALAHPLGNFTVNRYCRVDLSGNAVRVRYVLDLAEIPSVQERLAADSNADGVVSPAEWDNYKQRKAAEISKQLELTIDGERVSLEPTDVVVSQPPGQGDIPLVRLEMWLQPTSPLAPNEPHAASLRDRSDPARIGWREIVVHAGPGSTLSESNVPAQDVSDELRSYPDDRVLNLSPLDLREAHWSFRIDGTTSATASSPAVAVNRPTDPFAALITAADLNPTVILLALVGAALLGGIHAASPGHGKSIMAAYIVGTQGTILHASALAISVTLSHTAGVLVLGVLTMVASNLIFPDQLYPWLTLASGAIVLILGMRFLAVAARRGQHADSDHVHDHDHHHEHPHQHATPTPGLKPTWRALFALGLAGGIIPSGSALVVLLSSVALGRLGFGLLLIVAFGLGMAVVLVSTGVLLVHAGRMMLRLFPEGGTPFGTRLQRFMPLISASLMTLLGGVATLQGLTQIGLFGS